MKSSSPDMCVRLHTLTMVPEGPDVMVGRPDVGSYAVFPTEGAEILRRLESGATIGEVASWYEDEFGSTLDVDDYLQTLHDLEFVVGGEANDAPAPVKLRWQRLGRAVFSWPAWLIYAALIVAALIVMVHDPVLRPSYRNLFFTTHISLIPLTLVGATMPLVLLHESFHALAGRRLGLPSRLSIGRRLVYLVAETRMDALFSVPRRDRYLPFLAGMLADAVVTSVLTLLAAVLRYGEAPTWLWGLLLAIAFTCVLRLLWQFLFYLETDLYFVISTALRCADLQNTTRYLIRRRFRLLTGRRSLPDDSDPATRDRRIARWYAPILVAGYGFSLATFFWAALPTAIRIWSIAVERLVHRTSAVDTLDALAFFVVEGVPMALLGYVTVRDRRNRRRTTTKGAQT